MTNARVHEVGFALNVGRAGIWTYAGHVEYGGLIQYGYYIIEYEDGSTVSTTMFEKELCPFQRKYSHSNS